MEWSDSIYSSHDFGYSNLQGHFKSIEHRIASSFYSLDHSAIRKIAFRPHDLIYFKPSFNKLNKIVRQMGLTPLSALSTWDKITPMDISWHDSQERKGPPLIDWSYRFKLVHNCPFVLPKYSQLQYWILTNTLMSGTRYDDRGRNGNCPNATWCLDCNSPASPRHMFDSCTLTKQFWTEVDTLGKQFWSDYTPFNYIMDIPSLSWRYHPPTLFKFCAIWALWVQWCDFYCNRELYPPQRLALWIDELMVRLKEQVTFRLIEAPAVTQWVKILGDRRMKESPDDRASRKPEKEFLLIDTHSVVINPENPFDTKNVDLTPWIGNSVLCYRRNNKIAINHAVWWPWTSQVKAWDLPGAPPEDQSGWMSDDY